MNELKKIEKKWKNQFKDSDLVKAGIYQPNIANQLFHGFDDDSIHFKDFPVGFEDFNDDYNHSNPLNELDTVLKYLSFIGITLTKSKVEDVISSGKHDSHTFLKKTYYLLKQLSRYGEDLNTSDPYYDNIGDLFFFMRIEGSETEANQQLSLFEEVELPDFYNKYIELPKNYSNDTVAINLFKEIEKSNESYFITGKAGTGKSTFIHYFTKETSKNTLLFAFTGIAAINIGGQTLHSFFGFPFKPLLPKDKEIKKYNPNFQKYKILQKADTIIVDEVSMLRSDLLEALDYSLKINGGEQNKPFGGKQMLFVGDAFQLPPIVERGDSIQKHVFSEIYDSEYFFDAPAFKSLQPKLFELEQVHRQSEENFINNLNKIRTYEADSNVLNFFNRKYNPHYSPDINDFVMMLTSNNYIANEENNRKLFKIPYGLKSFQATISGDFKEDRYPTLATLELKRNAQVMFVKNDSYSNGRRWVNGTIGKVNFIKENSIEVELANGQTYEVERETWENRKYQWDKSKSSITSKVIGTFTQFPLKLAWAITIHKSQGLTFDKVNIDLGSGAFVNGQLYTAISRCKSIEGLTLKRKITNSDIIVDSKLVEFNKSISRGKINDFKSPSFLNKTIKNVFDVFEKTISSSKITKPKTKLTKYRLNSVLDFGIYEGEQLENALKKEPNYILNLLELEHFVIAPSTIEIIEKRIIDFKISLEKIEEMKLKNNLYLEQNNL
ncbi:ATP-dependent RecD-like DNA helicase [Aestuariivivens sp. NBU2969]|uniref:ATP-dependent DNA helicase n=1 Tax=Aestuariivivens sp. NBU2969 TaxID=2873267 RepID=UPI001CC05C93|nr:AAA family ATPase [Aestuariivivens sp. NBU2969]